MLRGLIRQALRAPRRSPIISGTGRKPRFRFLASSSAASDARGSDGNAATAAAAATTGEAPDEFEHPDTIPQYHVQGTTDFDAQAWEEYEFDEDPEEEAEIRELCGRILDAALDNGHVERDGWTNSCLGNAAPDAGFPNPATAPGLFGLEPNAGPWALVARFMERANERTVAALEELDYASTNAEGVVKFALRHRLEQVVPFAEADVWHQAMALGATPSRAPEVWASLGAFADAVWECAARATDGEENFPSDYVARHGGAAEWADKPVRAEPQPGYFGTAEEWAEEDRPERVFDAADRAFAAAAREGAHYPHGDGGAAARAHPGMGPLGAPAFERARAEADTGDRGAWGAMWDDAARRAMLIGVYGSAELYLLTDVSDDKDYTWGFLERQIETALAIAGPGGKPATAAVGLAQAVSSGLQSIGMALASMAGRDALDLIRDAERRAGWATQEAEGGQSLADHEAVQRLKHGLDSEFIRRHREMTHFPPFDHARALADAMRDTAELARQRGMPEPTGEWASEEPGEHLYDQMADEKAAWVAEAAARGEPNPFHPEQVPLFGPGDAEHVP